MMKIRKMRADDVPRITVLERDVFSDAWSEKSIMETLRSSCTLCAVAEDDNGICGYMLLYVAAGEGEIVRFAVSKLTRRKGVGSSLMSWLEAVCMEEQICKWLLDVRESNAAARLFYESCGFAEDGMRKNFYTAPVEAAILMSRRLGSQHIIEEAVPSRFIREEKI